MQKMPLPEFRWTGSFRSYWLQGADAGSTNFVVVDLACPSFLVQMIRASNSLLPSPADLPALSARSIMITT